MKGYQFSLRNLFAAIAVVGIGAALWVAEPSWRVGLIVAVLLIWVLASAVIVSIDSSGKARAMWIGIAANCITTTFVYLFLWTPIPEATLLLRQPLGEGIPGIPIAYFLANLSRNFRNALMIWAFAPVVGLLCVLTHWLLIRRPEPKA